MNSSKSLKKRYFVQLRVMLFLCGLMMCFITNLSAQNHSSPTIDSLQALLKKNAMDTAAVTHLLDLSREYAVVKPDTVLSIIRQASKLSEKIKYDKGIALSQDAEGVYLASLDSLGAALTLLKEAAKSFRRLGLRKELADNLTIQGSVYVNFSDHINALQCFSESAKLYENLGDEAGQASTFNQIGLVYGTQKNYAKAIEYYKKANNINVKINNQEGIIYNFGNLSDIYATQKEYEKAMEYAQKGLELAKTIKNSSLEGNMNMYLGYVYEMQNKLPNALDYYQKALQVKESIGDIFFVAVCNSFMARVYRQQQRAALANKADEVVLNIGESLNKPDLKQAAYEGLHQDYALLKDYEKAYEYQSKFTQLKDSLFNQQKTRQLAVLQAVFDSERKENEIQLLTQRSQLQRTIRNATFTGVAMLILLLGLLYNRLRLKQRKNQELEVKQHIIDSKNKNLEHLVNDKELLLKEIHHRVKNNLQIIMSLLDSQTENLKDKGAIAALQESQGRVQAMAMIHQNLYQTDDFHEINMEDYIQNLVYYLMDTMNNNPNIDIKFHLDPLIMDISTAVPVGLIINEAITNAIKYAFPDNRKGCIFIKFQQIDDISYSLVIEDDGVGVAKDFDKQQRRALGLRLIEGLTEQINGKLQINTAVGFGLSISLQQAINRNTYEYQF